MNLLFEILDDAAFLGLLNADVYQSYIAEDCEFEQIKAHLIQATQQGHLLLWGTTVPNFWTIRICDQPIASHEHRSFRGNIQVTHNSLYLTNYEALSLAAQFEDEQLPTNPLSALHIELENGIYDITVRQLFDPEQDTIESELLGFEVVVQKSTSTSLNNSKQLIWSIY